MLLRMRVDPKLPRGYARTVRSLGRAPETYSWKQGKTLKVPDDVGALLQGATRRSGRHDYPLFGDPKDDVVTVPPTTRDQLSLAVEQLKIVQAQVAELQRGRPPQEGAGV